MKNFYVVDDQVFKSDENKNNAKGKAIKYCRANGIAQTSILKLSNDSELEYYYYLKECERQGEIYQINSNCEVCLIGAFVNARGEQIPSLMCKVSFTYVDKKTNKPHIVYVAESIYNLNKNLMLIKTLYDLTRNDIGLSLEVYYIDENGAIVDWKIGDKDVYIKSRKNQHQKRLIQQKAIRDRQKFDRLLKLRSDGKITENQRKELYRLEKVFGGKS